MLKSRLLSERQVTSVARKKIVLVIVEGPSDDSALGVILNRLFDKNTVHVEIVYGDITTDRSISPKENDAYAFAKKYKDDLDGFLEFISDSDFSRMDGYRESWAFIKKDCHSLERFTNFGLCFSEIREERKKGKTERDVSN